MRSSSQRHCLRWPEVRIFIALSAQILSLNSKTIIGPGCSRKSGNKEPIRNLRFLLFSVSPMEATNFESNSVQLLKMISSFSYLNLQKKDCTLDKKITPLGCWTGNTESSYHLGFLAGVFNIFGGSSYLPNFGPSFVPVLTFRPRHQVTRNAHRPTWRNQTGSDDVIVDRPLLRFFLLLLLLFVCRCNPVSAFRFLSFIGLDFLWRGRSRKRPVALVAGRCILKRSGVCVCVCVCVSMCVCVWAYRAKTIVSSNSTLVAVARNSRRPKSHTCGCDSATRPSEGKIIKLNQPGPKLDNEK